MNEELALQIKAYDEFTSIFARFSSGLEGTEKASNAMVSAVDGLNQTVALLADAIQKLGPPTEQRKRALNEGAKAEKEITDAIKKHGTEVKAQEQTEQQSTTAVKQHGDALKGEAQAEQTTADAVKKHGKALTEEQIASKSAKEAASQLKDELKAKKKAEDEAAAATKEHTNAVDGLLQGLGAMGILATLKQGLSGVATAGGDLDRNLAIVKGATGQAREETQRFLMALPTTEQGVVDLSKGMIDLAFAGYDVKKSMQALPELSQFATASFQSMGDAMAPVITITKAYNKGIEEAGQITDVITMAQNKSAMEFGDFQTSLAASAAVAKLAGMDYEELIATISVLRDAGLRAEDAGTSIKSALLALMNPTTEAKKVMKDLGIAVYDSQGKMKSWADIAAAFDRAVQPLNEQSRNLALTTVLGSDGIRAMSLSMSRGSEYIRGMTTDLKNSQGATADMAHEMGNTFTGAMNRAQADVEKLKIAVFDDLKGAFSGLLNVVDTLVVGFNSLSPAMRGLIELFMGSAGLAGGIAAVATLAKSTLIPILAGLPALFTSTAVSAEVAGTAMAGAGASAEVAGGAMAALGGPIGIALLALGALVIGVTAYVGAQQKAKQEEAARGQSLLTLSGRYDELTKAVNSNIGSAEDHTKAAQDQQTAIKEIGDKFPELVKRWDDHGNAVVLDTERLNANTLAAKNNAKAQADAAYSKAQEAAASLEKQRTDLEGQIKLAEQPHSNAAKGFFMMPNSDGIPQLPPVADNFINSNVDKLKQDIVGVNQELEKANAEVNRAFAKLHGDPGTPDLFLRPGHPNPGGTGGGGGGGTKAYDPHGKTAEELAKEAEAARVKAIRDQMDLLKHLIGMDDQRVDTAREQLAFLDHIKATLGTTRDLDLEIHKLEVQIAREPLTEQLAAFEKRKQLGQVTARDEQQFYADLVAHAAELHLTEKERQEYQVRGIVAQKAAEKELQDLIQSDYRYKVDMENMSTADQIRNLNLMSIFYEKGSKERKAIALEIHHLETQLQSQEHDQRLAEIEFDTIVNRRTSDEKLAALKEYLRTATDLTVQQKRDLQKTIASMEQQSEQDHQRTLLDLLRQGYEAQRRVSEANLKARQKAEETAKQKEIDAAKNAYDGDNGSITKLRSELEAMQDQTKELDRQNRLLDLRTALKKADQEIEDAKKIKNRVIVERDSSSPLGFRLRRTYDEAKVKDLEKTRADAAKQLADEQAKQARDRAQEAIQDQIKALEKERDAKLKALNQQLSDMRTHHSEQMDELRLFWDDRLSEQKLKNELESTGWKTHFADVLGQTKQWVNDMNSEYNKLQQPAIQSGADLAGQLNGGQPPAGAPGAQSAGSSGNVTVNQYGDHNYNGVDGVEQATAGITRGAKRAI